MQILLASDLHYQLRHFDWLLDVAGDFDLVVLAGDHLDLGGAVALETQSVVVIRYLERLAARSVVAAASGNHDLTARNEYGEKEAAWLAGGRDVGALVDWDGADMGDVRVTVCPWWDGPRTRDDVEARLRDQAADRPAWWVWVYHPPPKRSPTSLGKARDYGDEDLRGWIEELEPDIVLSGHVHEAPFTNGGSWADHIGKTWAFNPGRISVGPIPNHVIIDLEAHTASWYGSGESGEVRLDS